MVLYHLLCLYHLALLRVQCLALWYIFYIHISKLTSSFKNISYHIDITITPENAITAIPKLQSCLKSVQQYWMESSKLKLNPEKTEIIVFGCKVLRNKLYHLCLMNIPGNILGN